jgi:hypothetical protein
MQQQQQFSGLRKQKNQIGGHALPQGGFGLSTPSGVEWDWAHYAGSRARADREQRMSPEANVDEPTDPAASTTEAPIQENKDGKDRAHSITLGAGTALDKGSSQGTQ